MLLSGQWLNNVDRTHLVLAGGKLVIQKKMRQEIIETCNQYKIVFLVNSSRSYEISLPHNTNAEQVGGMSRTLGFRPLLLKYLNHFSIAIHPKKLGITKKKLQFIENLDETYYVLGNEKFVKSSQTYWI